MVHKLTNENEEYEKWKKPRWVQGFELVESKMVLSLNREIGNMKKEQIWEGRLV